MSLPVPRKKVPIPFARNRKLYSLQRDLKMDLNTLLKEKIRSELVGSETKDLVQQFDVICRDAFTTKLGHTISPLQQDGRTMGVI